MDSKEAREGKKESRLKRRRSSIDDKLDLKFGQAVDEKSKEINDRKQKLIGNFYPNQDRKSQDRKSQ